MGTAKKNLTAPFPWFGGKRRVSSLVWERLGDVVNYVEPFAGSMAVLLGRPYSPKIETVNDLDCFVANFWRSVMNDPDGVARYADHPINEADLHARHKWLVSQIAFREKIMTDPNYYDVRIAGWWVWGLCLWIGSGWCTVRTDSVLCRKRPILSGLGGKGIHRKYQRPHLSGNSGATGQGIHAIGARQSIQEWMETLRDRLRFVRVACGDWSRVLGPSVTTGIGLCGVFLDPPYSASSGRRSHLYNEDSLSVADDVRGWCAKNGNRKLMRIALCGYEGEHNMLEELGWSKIAWETGGGYGNMNKLGSRGKKLERIWFSPHCLHPQTSLFDERI